MPLRQPFHNIPGNFSDRDGSSVSHDAPSFRLPSDWTTATFAKSMPEAGSDPDTLVVAVGESVAAFMRARYPKHTIKRVSADMGCGLDAPKNWLKGQAPGTKHLLWMIHKYGPDFLACILEPIGGMEAAAKNARIDVRLENLSQEIEHLRKEIADEG